MNPSWAYGSATSRSGTLSRLTPLARLRGVSGASAIFQEHVLLPHTSSGAVWAFSRPDQKPSHFHPQIEFVLVMRGKAVEYIGTEKYEVHPGQLIWHLPGIEHEMVSASADLDLRVVHVEPDLIACSRPQAHPAERQNPDSFGHWIRELGWLAAGRPVIELKRRDEHALLEDCDLPSTERRPGHDEQSERDRLARALGNAYRATCVDHDDLRPNSLVELACCLLLERPSLARSEVCRELGVSEGYLSRRFRAELGISFLEQRARLRLVRFLTHVTRERQNFLEASLSAGFGSYSQLHRVFSQLIGMSPRAYLQRGGRNGRGLVTGPQASPER